MYVIDYFFDLLLAPFNLFLIGILIIIGTIIMSLFFKSKKTVAMAMIIVVFGTILLFNQMQYTTFQKLVDDQLNEKTIVQSMSIHVDDLSGEVPISKAYVTIKDEKIIKQILNDLSDIKLKKEQNPASYFKEYRLSIITTNQKEKYALTERLELLLDNEYLNNYKIVSESNHLKTIKSLIDNKELDWTFYQNN